MSRWTTEKTLALIELFYNNDVLWDTRHAKYKNRNARKVAYKEILEEMRNKRVNMVSIEELKNKIRSLRATYFAEVSKIEKSKTAGDSPSYEPTLVWFKAMSFLNKSNEAYKEEETYVIEDCASDIKEAESPVPMIYINTSSYDNLNASKFTQTPPSGDSTKVTQKRPTNDSDEFDVFGQNVSLQLKQMPLEYALETQEIIMRVLKEQRVRCIRKGNLPLKIFDNMEEDA